MTGDLGLHLDSTKESVENARHQESIQAEGDDIQVLQCIQRHIQLRHIPAFLTSVATELLRVRRLLQHYLHPDF